MNTTSPQTRFFVWLVNFPAVPIAVCGLFWCLLNLYCSEWNALLEAIARAEELLSNGGNYFDKPKAFPNPPSPNGTLGLALLILLYVGKWQLINRLKSRVTTALWYTFVVNVAVVYYWLRWEDWENFHVTILGNWLGTPIIFLFIPTVTFGFDLFAKPRELRFYVMRSAVEIIAMPVWLYVWIFISMAFGLMWL